MATFGRGREMAWAEVLGYVMAMGLGEDMLVVNPQGDAEYTDEWVYARLAHENPHRYMLAGRHIYSLTPSGQLGERMWSLAPRPAALLVANGQCGPAEWMLTDDDRITFRLWSSKAVYRLVEKPHGLEPVLVYKAGAAWCFESDSACWQMADRLAERVTRDRRLAQLQRAS